MRTRLALALAVAAIATACGTGRSDAAVRLQVVASGLQSPLYLTAPPGSHGRLFIVEKGGKIVIDQDGHILSRAFLNISRLVSNGSEQGLLGMAFDPHYRTNHLFYISYTNRAGNSRIVQYRRSAHNANRANPNSHRTLLKVHQPFSNHNGGDITFGPNGRLYIGFGDGGSEGDPENNGQNTKVLLGKILRIDPSPRGTYTVPATNPFSGKSRGRGEIWAYGLRNPWRFSFDRANGDLIIGDVGQDLQEEIDFAPAGASAGGNYGWSIFEGRRRNKAGSAPHAIPPVLVAQHSRGYCAIIGGYVVRDRSLPNLYGRYLFGDNCRPQIESVNLRRGHASGLRASGLEVSATSSFGEDASGRIYITSLNGPVYRLVRG